MDMRSVTFTLRDTDKTDAANNASDTATLKFSSANYNEASGTLTIKIIDKNTDADTLKIDVPATVTYGDTVANPQRRRVQNRQCRRRHVQVLRQGRQSGL